MKLSNQSDFSNEIEIYFNDIKKYYNLSKEEEKKIGELIKKGDEEAINKLIVSNLKFVIMVAKNYKSYGIQFSDLISEGNVGLIRAAKKYDFSKDNKFISYAVWWIKQSIQEFIKKNTINTNEFNSLFSNNEKVDNNGYIINNLYEKENDNIEKSKTVYELLDCLNKRENDIIQCYFGLNDSEEMTLEEIGNKYGLTKERVRQIKEKALIKLRSNALLNNAKF